MTMAPAQIVNYTLHSLDAFYGQLDNYMQWGEFDWYMNCANTLGRLTRHTANECKLSVRQTRTVKGSIRNTFYLNDRIIAKRNIGQELYDRGAVGVVM